MSLQVFFDCVLPSVLQDCDHVSQTAEEFYTVRCQVADMKNIYVSAQNTHTSKIADFKRKASELSCC